MTAKANAKRATRSPKTTTKRGPGRPSAAEGNSVSRVSILQNAFEMSRTIPLQDLSIVLVAKRMGITPALIHYYIGGRDWLTSGVMNLFYKEMIEAWPKPTGRWEADIFEVALVIYGQYIKYAGIAAYSVSHNRFRTFQLLQDGEHDYGVEVLDRFTRCAMEAGLPADRTAIYGHMLFEFIISNANNAIRHRFPGEYPGFLQEQVEGLSATDYPGIHFTTHALDNFDASAAFNEGCRLILLGMQSEQLRTALSGGNEPQAAAAPEKPRRTGSKSKSG